MTAHQTDSKLASPAHPPAAGWYPEGIPWAALTKDEFVIAKKAYVESWKNAIPHQVRNGWFVLREIAFSVNYENGDCYPSKAHLARSPKKKISEKTVQRMIYRLEDMGILDVLRLPEIPRTTDGSLLMAGRRANRYRVNWALSPECPEAKEYSVDRVTAYFSQFAGGADGQAHVLSVSPTLAGNCLAKASKASKAAKPEKDYDDFVADQGGPSAKPKSPHEEDWASVLAAHAHYRLTEIWEFEFPGYQAHLTARAMRSAAATHGMDRVDQAVQQWIDKNCGWKPRDPRVVLWTFIGRSNGWASTLVPCTETAAEADEIEAHLARWYALSVSTCGEIPVTDLTRQRMAAAVDALGLNSVVSRMDARENEFSWHPSKVSRALVDLVQPHRRTAGIGDGDTDPDAEMHNGAEALTDGEDDWDSEQHNGGEGWYPTTEADYEEALEDSGGHSLESKYRLDQLKAQRKASDHSTPSLDRWRAQRAAKVA